MKSGIGFSGVRRGISKADYGKSFCMFYPNIIESYSWFIL